MRLPGLRFSLLLLLSLSFGGHARGAETDWSVFAAHDPNSKITVDHSPFDQALRRSVLPVGKARRRMASATPRKMPRSHIAVGNTSPSRYEANRALYHLYKDKQIAYFKSYQQGLQALSDQVPLAKLNRREQLVYWLNLHNVTVLIHLAEKYPVKNLKYLRRGKRGGVPFWEQKLLSVQGIPLSLEDIEKRILFPIWNDSIIIYGLYQGAIGGPSLPNQAFTAENVDKLLRRNANEFVNSNRGLRNWGGEVQVSLVYKWSEQLFPDWNEDLKIHLMTYADPPLVARLGTIEGFNPKLYDWVIADLMGGDLKRGDAVLNSAALLGTEVENMQYLLALARGLSTNTLPPHAIDTLRGIARNTEPPGRPKVEIKECGPGECE